MTDDMSAQPVEQVSATRCRPSATRRSWRSSAISRPRPPYVHLPRRRGAGQALVQHAGQRKEACRERSAEELAKLAPNMRAAIGLPARARAGRRSSSRWTASRCSRVVAPPTGLSRDGASTVYRRVAVPAGTHRFVARLKDTAGGDFGYVGERTRRARAGPRAGDRLRREGRRLGVPRVSGPIGSPARHELGRGSHARPHARRRSLRRCDARSNASAFDRAFGQAGNPWRHLGGARFLPVLDRRGHRHLRLHRLRHPRRRRLRLGRAPVVERVPAGVARAQPASLCVRRVRARRRCCTSRANGCSAATRTSAASRGSPACSRCGSLFASGIGGFWLVWDRLAQYSLIATTEWLDALPVFGGALIRNFIDARRGERPALLAADLPAHRHSARAARGDVGARAAAVAPGDATRRARSRGARWPRSRCCRSRCPVASDAPADLAVAPGTLALDWFYLGVHAFADAHVAARAVGRAPAASRCCCSLLPWLSRAARAPRPVAAVVDLANCNGCARCFADCPYAAVTMQPRTDGKHLPRQAVVDPDLCAGCGICAGACPSSTPFRSRRRARRPASTCRRRRSTRCAASSRRRSRGLRAAAATRRASSSSAAQRARRRGPGAHRRRAHGRASRCSARRSCRRRSSSTRCAPAPTACSSPAAATATARTASAIAGPRSASPAARAAPARRSAARARAHRVDRRGDDARALAARRSQPFRAGTSQRARARRCAPYATRVVPPKRVGSATRTHAGAFADDARRTRREPAVADAPHRRAPRRRRSPSAATRWRCRATRGARLALGWLALGVAALAASGILAVLLVLSRTPGLARPVPGRGFLPRRRWSRTSISRCWCGSSPSPACCGASTARRGCCRSGWAALALAALGTAAMARRAVRRRARRSWRTTCRCSTRRRSSRASRCSAPASRCSSLRGLFASPLVGMRLDGAGALRFGLNGAIVATAVALLALRLVVCGAAGEPRRARPTTSCCSGAAATCCSSPGRC